MASKQRKRKAGNPGNSIKRKLRKRASLKKKNPKTGKQSRLEQCRSTNTKLNKRKGSYIGLGRFQIVGRTNLVPYRNNPKPKDSIITAPPKSAMCCGDTPTTRSFHKFSESLLNAIKPPTPNQPENRLEKVYCSEGNSEPSVASAQKLPALFTPVASLQTPTKIRSGGNFPRNARTPRHGTRLSQLTTREFLAFSSSKKCSFATPDTHIRTRLFARTTRGTAASWNSLRKNRQAKRVSRLNASHHKPQKLFSPASNEENSVPMGPLWDASMQVCEKGSEVYCNCQRCLVSCSLFAKLLCEAVPAKKSEFVVLAECPLEEVVSRSVQLKPQICALTQLRTASWTILGKPMHPEFLESNRIETQILLLLQARVYSADVIVQLIGHVSFCRGNFVYFSDVSEYLLCLITSAPIEIEKSDKVRLAAKLFLLHSGQYFSAIVRDHMLSYGISPAQVVLEAGIHHPKCKRQAHTLIESKEPLTQQFAGNGWQTVCSKLCLWLHVSILARGIGTSNAHKRQQRVNLTTPVVSTPFKTPSRHDLFGDCDTERSSIRSLRIQQSAKGLFYSSSKDATPNSPRSGRVQTNIDAQQFESMLDAQWDPHRKFGSPNRLDFSPHITHMMI